MKIVTLLNGKKAGQGTPLPNNAIIKKKQFETSQNTYFASKRTFNIKQHIKIFKRSEKKITLVGIFACRVHAYYTRTTCIFTLLTHIEMVCSVY